MLLSSAEIKRIDATSLSLLEEVGIVVGDEMMRDSLASVGCRVHGQRVWLPRAFVEDLVRQAPPMFDLHCREGNGAMTIGGRDMLLSNSGVNLRMYDLESGELRKSTIQDVRDTTRVLDALPLVGPVLATLVEPTDVPERLTIVKGFEATLRNTSKPIVGPGVTNRAEAEVVVAMGTAIRDSADDLAKRPLFAPWLSIHSPLTFHAGLVEALRVCTEARLPVALVSNPITGLTAPLTLVGALTQLHAELLAGVALAQHLCPGLPVLYQPSLSTVDLRSLSLVTGSPESAVAKQAGVLLGRHRSMPTTGFGLSSGSRVVDVEYGYEKAANGLACALAHPSILSGIGPFGDAALASYESLVIDHEIAGFVCRLVRSMDTEDGVAVQVIKDVMEGDAFITHPHTLAHLRDGEYWTATLRDTCSQEEWMAAGCPHTLSRAREKAREILAHHSVSPIPEAAEQRLRAVLERGEAALTGDPTSEA